MATYKRFIRFGRACGRTFRQLYGLQQMQIVYYICKNECPLVVKTPNWTGAFLEEDGRVVAYASRALSQSEKSYSVIQRAMVYAMKQFQHYISSWPSISTDTQTLLLCSGYLVRRWKACFVAGH